MKGSPMIVLDQFRSQVRQLLAAKDDYENLLKAELEAASASFQMELKGLKTEVDELRAYKEASEDVKRATLKKVDHAEHAKNMVVQESRSLVDSMKGDAQRFVLKIQEKQDEIDALEKKIKDPIYLESEP